MIKYENHCVDCERCISCGNKAVKVHICEICNEEIDPDDIYMVDDEEMCQDCLLEKFKMG